MTRTGVSITLLLAGATASMPMVMVGHILAQRYGTLAALLAIGIGNALLCAVGVLTAHLALKYKTTTSDTVGELGGAALSKVFAVAMVISMLGWFAVQCSILVEFASGYLPHIPHIFLTAAIGISLIATAMGEMTRLLWLSEKLGPVLLLACLAMFLWSLGDARFEDATQPSFEFWPAVSLVLAASLGVVIDLPTYLRVLRSRRDAICSVVVVAWLVPFIVQTLGVLLLPRYDSLGLIVSPFGIVLALSGWLMNVNNLYSAVVSSQTLLKGESFALRSVVLGSIALAAVALHAADSLGTSVEIITLGISSMGGVMAACALVSHRDSLTLTLSWAVGTFGGALSLSSIFTLTGAAQIDAFLTAVFFTVLSLLGVWSWQSRLSTNNS